MKFWLYSVETKEEKIEDHFYWFEHMGAYYVKGNVASTLYDGDFQIGFLSDSPKSQDQIRWSLLHDMKTIRHASMDLGQCAYYDRTDNDVVVICANDCSCYSVSEFFDKFDFNLGWEVLS